MGSEWSSSSTQQREESALSTRTSSGKGRKTFSRAEVARHNTANDLWIIVEGKVYDVTGFAKDHPGGVYTLIDVAGTDASLEFEEAQHSESARRSMEQYLIGAVAESGLESESEVLAEELRARERENGESQTRLLVLYGTQKGQSRIFADRLSAACLRDPSFPSNAMPVCVQSMRDFDPEDLAKESFVLMFISTYTDGAPPEDAAFFYKWVGEATEDFRVNKGYLSNVCFGVYGCGNSLYEENYNVPSRQLDHWMERLGAKRVVSRGESDDSVSRPDVGTAESDFDAWVKASLPLLASTAHELLRSSANRRAVIASLPSIPYATSKADQAEEAKEEREADEDEDEEQEDDASDGDDGDDEASNRKGGSRRAKEETMPESEPLVDLEDLGSTLASSSTLANGSKATSDVISANPRQQRRRSNKGKGKDEEESIVEAKDKEGDRRPMITPTVRENLTKQGYRLLGTHSGVKLCRWTKAMLRGRGGCYKHTFYGIKSYQCMEMTPSLACANKCVFCWRHHTNPVGKDWKWLVDDPEFLIEEAVRNHQSMIKELKGVPGVRPDRFEEAFNIRHCALSLVGEPIMYPHINRFVELLHSRKISSFLVTNAQFPERIEGMDPVTQLYVSVDASTHDSLKAVDRPLFKDFWERYLRSLRAIRTKSQRTVYRLTLVKGFNMNEIPDYARLVDMGRPTFIEIKGVTFCGQNNASNLTLQNVPFHIEVRNFALELCKYLGSQYEMACEHAHSCCVLIADTKLKINGRWHTWIDYDRFHVLVQEWHRTRAPFDVLDYAEPTPAWAVFGAEEEGFDPEEQRHYRKNRKAPRHPLSQQELDRLSNVAPVVVSAAER